MTVRAAQRVDRWLWFARFFKTRSAAARLVAAGRVRIGTGGATRRMAKPSQTVAEGDVLTFPQGRQVRVVRIVALGHRRGPAPEAATLFEDLAPPGAAGRSE
ncbi:MAG: RNA-binding S4 domain-containing protein [Alphaproteobacteria bacterium]